MPQLLSTLFNKLLTQINQLNKIQSKTPATSQGFSTLPGAYQNPLGSTGLISMDVAEILQPVKHEKSKYTTKSDHRRTWREKIASKHDEKI